MGCVINKPKDKQEVVTLEWYLKMQCYMTFWKCCTYIQQKKKKHNKLICCNLLVFCFVFGTVYYTPSISCGNCCASLPQRRDDSFFLSTMCISIEKEEEIIHVVYTYLFSNTNKKKRYKILVWTPIGYWIPNY